MITTEDQKSNVDDHELVAYKAGNDLCGVSMLQVL